MKTMEQFYNEIIESEELSEKLASVFDEQKLEEFLKENEVDCTTNQFNEFILAKAKEGGELTDEQLSAVAGGDECGGIPIDYADSGSRTDGMSVTLSFSQHQRVLYKLKGNALAEIISCRTKIHYGYCYKDLCGNGKSVRLKLEAMRQPVYDIRMIDTNEIIKDVIQSCLAPYTLCSL